MSPASLFTAPGHPCRRLGLTMRVSRDAAHGEVRDALARDWIGFMAVALPGVDWVPVPNLGTEAAAWADRQGLDGLVLTGGNDLGESPERDATEAALLLHCLELAQPVLGVCRGLQLIVQVLGGQVEPCSRPGHVAVQHAVDVSAWARGQAGPRTVNSFHGFGVRPEGLPGVLAPAALSRDGLVEALAMPGRPLAAVQWHPERGGEPRAEDLALVRFLFGWGEDACTQ